MIQTSYGHAFTEGNIDWPTNDLWKFRDFYRRFTQPFPIVLAYEEMSIS